MFAVFFIIFYFLLKFRMWFKYGLKAQKLLAQGIALGIMAISKAPCKGKSFVYCQVFESFCPYRACGAYLRNFSEEFKCKVYRKKTPTK